MTTGGFGRALVLLHHVGAHSGQERVTPVMGLRQDPGTWLVAAWARFTAASPGFRQYEERTARTIPVVALHRSEA